MQQVSVPARLGVGYACAQRSQLLYKETFDWRFSLNGDPTNAKRISGSRDAQTLSVDVIGFK